MPYLVGLLAVLVGLYWSAASMRGVFYVGDIYRLGYPARYEYAQALAQGRVPLWTPNAVAGFPVLAEGQTGAYYPLNLLLYRLLPLTVALNYSILVAFWIAGAGTFLYARLLGLRRAPAFLAGCTFMLGGFVPGHLNHMNMLAAAAWLPLLLWAVERATRRAGWGRWAVVGLLFGVQGLAGHPQVSLLSALLVGVAATAGPLAGEDLGRSLRRRACQALLCGAALAFGAVLAAVQWAPTLELTRLSQRGQGLDAEFFTSFSLSPAHFVTLLWPFIQGNPYPLTSLETIGYMGALPLVFAVLAPLHRRDRLVVVWLGVALAAVALSLGRWNPAYHWLMRVPLLNMFRAPARYLLWLDLAVAILAGVSLDWLLSRTRERAGAWGAAWPGGLAIVGLGGWWVARQPLPDLVQSWRYLPLVWLAGTAALLLALRVRPPRRLWGALVVGLVLVDLGAFNGVYNRTYNATMAPADLIRPPQSASFLQGDGGSEPYRIYTNEQIVPVLPVMRESLYPNIQLLHGVQSLNGYYPLLSGPQRWLLANLNPRLIDLLNVRYVLIPQIMPVDEASEAYDTEDPFAPSIVGRAFDLSGPSVAGLEVEGYLSHAADLPDGTPVGQVTLRTTEGEELTWTLEAGRDLSEWAYERDDVQLVIRHKKATVIRSWPARSGLPPRDHPGLTYVARYTLPKTVDVQQLEVRPLVAQGYLRLERLRLIAPTGASQLLSSLAGEGDHILVYRSEDVAIYRNTRVGPRAFLVHRARVASTEQEAERWVADAAFQPEREAVLLDGQGLDTDAAGDERVAFEAYGPEYARLRVTTVADGYLVLADSYYPGWTVRVDGQPAKVLRADVALRAVALPPGEHVVEFAFAPASWRFGLAASAIAWGALELATVALVLRFAGRRRQP